MTALASGRTVLCSLPGSDYLDTVEMVMKDLTSRIRQVESCNNELIHSLKKEAVEWREREKGKGRE